MGAEGVKWVTNNSSPTLTRYHGASGSNTLYSPANQAAATTYFNSLAPWGVMGRVSLRPDGSVASRCNVNTTPLQTGDNCYSDIDTTGSEMKMVYIPQFCYHVDQLTTNQIWYWVGAVGDTFRLSDNSGDYTFSSSDIHPAFISNTVAKSGVYVGAYEGYYNSGTTKLESRGGITTIADTQPTALVSITNFRTYANNNGAGWGLMMYQAWCAAALLAIIEYGSWYLRSVLSYGISNITQNGSNNCSCNTGHTTTLGNASGQVTFTSEGNGGATQVTTYAMSYRGIENMWGNLFQFVDGINIRAGSDYHIFTADNGTLSSTSSNGTTGAAFSAPYADTSIVQLSSGNNIEMFDYTQTLKWLFIGSTGGASTGQYTCAYQTIAATSNVLLMGGDYGYAGAGTGPFVEKNITYNGTSRNYGARLQYTPQ
jgi:hypothetical protein